MILPKEKKLEAMLQTGLIEKRSAIMLGIAMACVSHTSGNLEKFTEMLRAEDENKKFDLARACAETVFSKVNETVVIPIETIELITSLIMTRLMIFKKPTFNSSHSFEEVSGIYNYIPKDLVENYNDYITEAKEAHAIAGAIIKENCGNETHEISEARSDSN